MLLQKPSDLDKYNLGIFGRANRVTQENAKILSEIGVVDVTIGFESGDKEVLHNCNKLFSSPEQNIKAVEHLTQVGIDITASYVLGMPGENSRSLKNTIENARRVVEISTEITGHPPKELVANLLEPIPGSPVFRRLVKEFPEKYYLKDVLDLEMMQKDYFRVYFDIDTDEKYHSFRKMLRDAANEIHKFVSFSDAQGWLADEQLT